MSTSRFAERLHGLELSTGTGPLVLRPATAADDPFAQGLLEDTMRPYVEKALVTPAAVAGYFQKNAFALRVADTVVGTRQGASRPLAVMTARFEVDPVLGDAVDLFAIHVSPDAQGQGLGRALLRAVIDTANPLPVTLIVLEMNPARRLYEALGFEVARQGSGHTEHRLHMVRHPD